MTFSLRTSLIVTSILACWLGALVSKSPMLMELVASATALLILLTLAFAIWDSRPEQRAFWTGFFVLAFGNLILAHYFEAYQQTGNELATRILGPPNAAVYTPSYMPPPSLSPAPFGPPNPNTSYYQPLNPPPINPANPTFVMQVSTNTSANYYQQFNAIRMAVPSLLSLVAGVIGGWLTLWISRQAKKASDEIPVGTPI
jgi:hypothetical protein